MVGGYDGYLMETSALSALLDPKHKHHAAAQAAMNNLDVDAPKHASAIALAELMYGFRLHEAAKGIVHREASHVISVARTYRIRDVTRHTSAEYAELKTNLASTYMKKALSKENRRWIEDWVDSFTGKKLQIDENDLWICAQAREVNFILVTSDRRMKNVVSKADPKVQFLLIE